MRQTKNNSTGLNPINEISQQIQPNKICFCGACEAKKPKRIDGKRRLKISTKTIVYERSWFKQNSTCLEVPQIRLEGKWLRKTGFEMGQHIVITEEMGKLIIEVEKD